MTTFESLEIDSQISSLPIRRNLASYRPKHDSKKAAHSSWIALLHPTSRGLFFRWTTTGNVGSTQASRKFKARRRVSGLACKNGIEPDLRWNPFMNAVVPYS